MIGIYIHIPFCIRKCPYCDFYSQKFSKTLCDEYVDALFTAIKNSPNENVNSIYFGGGTPNLLDIHHFEKIFDAIESSFYIDKNAEISLESNPALCNIEKLKALRNCGFNRISIGLQSLCDDELEFLGRLHNAQQAKSAVFDAANAQFENISVDFMTCLPNQTSEKLLQTLQQAAKLPITHISSYMLKIEENTPFFKQNLTLPDDEEASQMYLDAANFLEENGFLQYEISNFAKKGFECRHNLKYWQCEEYLGFGPAAHSYYQGRRFAAERDLNAFLKNPQKVFVTDDSIDEFEEKLMLNLRLSSGFDTKGVDDERCDRVLKNAKNLSKHGLLDIKNGVITLTKQGFLVSNSIIVNLLYNQ